MRAVRNLVAAKAGNWLPGKMLGMIGNLLIRDHGQVTEFVINNTPCYRTPVNNTITTGATLKIGIIPDDLIKTSPAVSTNGNTTTVGADRALIKNMKVTIQNTAAVINQSGMMVAAVIPTNRYETLVGDQEGWFGGYDHLKGLTGNKEGRIWEKLVFNVKPSAFDIDAKAWWPLGQTVRSGQNKACWIILVAVQDLAEDRAPAEVETQSKLSLSITLEADVVLEQGTPQASTVRNNVATYSPTVMAGMPADAVPVLLDYSGAKNGHLMKWSPTKTDAVQATRSGDYVYIPVDMPDLDEMAM